MSELERNETTPQPAEMAPMPATVQVAFISTNSQATPNWLASLQRSPQQLKVAQLLVQGMTSQQAAAHLGRSPRTIEMHRSFIVQKTGLDNLAALTHAALDACMVPLPAAEKFIAPFQTLSARERSVLALITKGDANKIIASKLDLSVRTVESYRASVMEKMGIDNVAGLVCAVRALATIGITLDA